MACLHEALEHRHDLALLILRIMLWVPFANATETRLRLSDSDARTIDAPDHGPFARSKHQRQRDRKPERLAPSRAATGVMRRRAMHSPLTDRASSPPARKCLGQATEAGQ
jgi:hypothetical protein